jgi:hypothetical protein
MPASDELAAFQAALLELLALDLAVEEMQRRLREDATFAAFRSYVDEFEPRMIIVASELVKKWGRRTQGDSDERIRSLSE